MRNLFSACLFLLLVATTSRVEGSVILGQIETFDDPHNWVIAAGPMIGVPVAVPTALGGPGGAADPFLSLVSTGGDGPGSRLTAQNFDEWSGDYLAAGVNRIGMDVRNFGASDVFLRLLFVEFGAMGPVGAALTTNPIVVPGGSDWNTIQFDISPAALTGLFGTGTGALSNAGELRIFHSVLPIFAPGQNAPIVANLGVDNITAAQAAVPEPATLMLFSGAVLCGLSRRRKRNPVSFRDSRVRRSA